MAKTITAEELKQKMEKGEKFTLIEVLSPEEYMDKHLPRAINIPADSISEQIKQRFRPDQELIVYCASKECNASPNAAKKLEEMGFKNVIDFEAGKKGWENAGYEFETD